MGEQNGTAAAEEDKENSAITFLHGQEVEHNGWLIKRSNGMLPVKKKRYFIISGSELTCRAAPNDESKWTINLLNAQLETDREKLRLVVTAGERKVQLQAANSSDFAAWEKAIKSSRCQNIEQFYELGDTIGEGGFAVVKVGIDRETMTKYAVKIVHKQLDDEHNMQFLHRELLIMKTINSPHVIRTFDVFDSPRELYFVLEYMAAGTLHELYQKNKPFSEQQVSSVMFDILSGIKYLHSKRIVHRDLKLKNVLASNKEMPFNLKLADFGLSNFVGPTTTRKVVLKSQVGSPHYVAPEVLRDTVYGPAVDLWSIGVMMHIMLSGKYPFAGKTIPETLEMVARAHFRMRDDWFPEQLSADAIDLLHKLLQEDPKKRITAADALQHPFILNKSG
ncbi:Myosin light chain kinase A [Porphyridium purpureum]|uniref:Myosin light chain kinase A n=1 Tax=Porphyridium purpureum TaxID=35688 RepID=A0A5J4YJZ1_PORPP|nr:Myosin light chain kinase A [Porphyridium purpureum]|eukprot:POR2849..scf291_13